ncbi:MAG: TraR/DksA C4-type zinc finger protein [Candidatus Rokubacteria bacterium]|nr:TraR/DksA C4-type zinc finger protein [Candidatus Rokubacteria bacterium]
MDKVKERIELELNRTVERIRRMDSDLRSEPFAEVTWHRAVDDQAEAGSLSEEREMSFASRSLVIERMRRLAEALKHVEHGDYGMCRECGESIAPARLRVMPEVTTCIRCQERLEHGVVLARNRQHSNRRRAAPC